MVCLHSNVITLWTETKNRTKVLCILVTAMQFPYRNWISVPVYPLEHIPHRFSKFLRGVIFVLKQVMCSVNYRYHKWQDKHISVCSKSQSNTDSNTTSNSNEAPGPDWKLNNPSPAQLKLKTFSTTVNVPSSNTNSILL